VAVPVLIGTAVLDANVLVDSLVPEVIDGLREDLHPAFGVRAYSVYRVLRTWGGKVAGEGARTDVAHELRPQPKVEVWNGLRFEQMTCGVNEAGEIRLSEISLTYTEAQLTGKPLAKNAECFIAVGEAHGQGSFTRLYGHTRPPFVDREKTMGWMMWLRAVDGVPWVP
jgi:hypothetical protein